VNQRHFSEALADAERAIELAKTGQSSEPFSAYTGGALRALGFVKERVGERRQAAEAYGLAAAHFASTLGESNPQTRQAKEAAIRVTAP
jgi:hypothetical protein